MPSPGQEQLLQLTLLDYLVDPGAGSSFEADPAGFGRVRGVLPPHDAALHRFMDRLQIYRNAARNGVQDLLETFFPVTRSQLEASGAWEGCVSDYIASRGITTPYYRDIIPGFVGWLSASAWGHASWPSLLAVAHFELLEFLVERWPDIARPPQLRDRPEPGDRIVLDPATRLVHYAHAVHRATVDHPVPDAEPTHLLAYRDRGGDFHVLELTESTAALLARGQEASVEEAVALLGPEGAASAMGLLQDLADQEALWGFDRIPGAATLEPACLAADSWNKGRSNRNSFLTRKRGGEGSSSAAPSQVHHPSRRLVMRPSAFFLSALVLGAPLVAGPKVFTPDTNHSFFGFKAATLLFEVPGRFEKYKVNIQGDPADLATVKIRIELETKSVNTANKMRDDHLRSEDFFDAPKYPKIVFVSEKAWREGDKVVVKGTLGMNGVTKPLQIPFTESTGLNGAGVPTWAYRATLPIDRKDFNIGAESVAAKISLKNEVVLNLMLVGFFKDAPAGAAPKTRQP